MSDPLEGYLTVAQLAAHCHRSVKTVRRWLREPDGLPHTKLGGTVLINVDSFRDWLAARERRPNPRRAA